MCGITGCLQKKKAMVTVIGALHRLQNRGYDSAGVCCLHQNKLIIQKYISDSKQNAIDSINMDPISRFDTDIAIGHTRWATHGPKTVQNAHPHFDDTRRFSLVHNGIIENYQTLRSTLLQHNYQFYGQTDSEVAVKFLHFLIEHGGDIRAFHQSLQGSWAIIYMDSKQPNKLFFLKNGSPLIIGFNKDKDKIMFASELTGFDKDITKYHVIEDGDYGFVTVKKRAIVNSTKQYQQKMVPHSLFETTLGEYPHWTLKEIHDQPWAIRQLIQSRLVKEKLFFPELNTLPVKNSDHFIFLGCGTSYHAACTALPFFKKFSGATMEVIDGSDFEPEDIPPERNTLLILLSQSGETKDLYRALTIGKKHHLPSIGIINVENSLIARQVDAVLYLKAGREHAVASTKSFTNQVVMLLMLSLWLSSEEQPDTKKYLRDMKNLPQDYERIIKLSLTEIPKMVPLFHGQNHCFILGKGMNEWIAKEGALKIKEISYIHAEGFSASALKHGPFALLTEKIPVILLANDDRYNHIISNATSEIKSRKATTIHITNKFSMADTDQLFYYDTQSNLFPLLSIVPLQVLAYYLALEREHHPDYPRNLAKVVTVD